MKSRDAFQRTYSNNVVRLDAYDGFIFNPNVHNGATLLITDNSGAFFLELDLAAMTNGDSFRAVFYSLLSISCKEGSGTLIPASFTGYGIVDFLMVDGNIYATAGADVELDALKTAVGTYAGDANISTDLAATKAKVDEQGMAAKIEAAAARKDEIPEILNHKIINLPIINDSDAARDVFNIGLADTTGVIKLSAVATGDSGFECRIDAHAEKGHGVSVTWENPYLVIALEVNDALTPITTAYELKRALLATDTLQDSIIVELSADDYEKVVEVTSGSEPFTGGESGHEMTSSGTDIDDLVAQKIVVGVTPTVAATKAKVVFGTGANYVKVQAVNGGTAYNGWVLTGLGSTMSKLTASAFVVPASKKLKLRYKTNTSAQSVSITPASLAAVLNRDASAYFTTTVSGSVSKFNLSQAGCLKFTGTTASGLNDGTVAAMGKLFVADDFSKLYVCISGTDGSEITHASKFVSTILS